MRGLGSFALSPFWHALFVLLLARVSFAADLQTRLSADRVGVGQTFVVQVTAPSEDGKEPTHPTLQVRGAASVQGPSIQTQRSVVMHNFNVQTESNVIATWRVTPTATGTLVLGPAQFSVGSRTLTGEAVKVEVVDAPQPRARSRGPFGSDPSGNDPFGMFGPNGPFGRNSPFGQDPFGDDPFGRFMQLRDAPSEWQLSHAADPVAFLDARLDKKQVVLGEPVRLTILAYGSRGDFSEIAERSPSLADFVSFPVVQNSMEEPLYQTTIDGQRFAVRKLREFVLVPLSTGKLTIGPMWTVLQNQRRAYPRSPSYEGMKVTSLPLTLQVDEAPEKGKPMGYFPGDVGRYKLNAAVTPRNLKQGEYIQVLITISGEGYVPSKVLLPESKQVVWNTPAVRGEPEITNDRLQGSRTLDFSVKIVESGTVDLGEVRLPYYDARAKRYRVASADLGQVTVEPSATAPAPTPSPGTILDLATPLAPRPQLGPVATKDSVVPAWAWWTILGMPFSVLLARGSARVSNVVLTRARSPKSQGATGHLTAARAQFQTGHVSEGLGELERALISAIFDATGLRARGILKSDLAKELHQAGLPENLSGEVALLLEELETARYAPTTTGGKEMAAQAEQVVRQLFRLSGKKGRTT